LRSLSLSTCFAGVGNADTGAKKSKAHRKYDDDAHADEAAYVRKRYAVCSDLAKEIRTLGGTPSLTATQYKSGSRANISVLTDERDRLRDGGSAGDSASDESASSSGGGAAAAGGGGSAWASSSGTAGSDAAGGVGETADGSAAAAGGGGSAAAARGKRPRGVGEAADGSVTMLC
jgi:hypothetical protein